jgi:hypothetical protein
VSFDTDAGKENLKSGVCILMCGKREFRDITSIFYCYALNIEFWHKFKICKDGLGSTSLHFSHEMK